MLNGFLIHSIYFFLIHNVHTLFMHEAYPYSLQVYMVLHCICFLWLFLWWARPVIQKVDLYIVFFTMFIICELQGTWLERWFKWRRLVPRLKKKVTPRVREKEMVCPILARAWQKSRYWHWDTREDSPTLTVVVEILTD